MTSIARKGLWSIALGLALTALSSEAQAGHHQWIITELYSNADGTIQFVELKGTANNEQGIGPFSINSFGTVPTSAGLSPNLPSAATNGAYLLVATSGYATLAAAQGAPAPDRIMPNSFLQLDVDTVRYAGIPATDRSYTAGGLPSDGIDSLDFENPGATVNSPQNFAGAIGTINAAPPPPTPAVPALPRWGIIVMVGSLVFAAGLALRRRAALI